MQTNPTNVSEDAWATACTHIMTSPGAREEDLRACRDIMTRRSYDTEWSWPMAVTMLGVAAAAAWGVPRCIRAFIG